MITIEFLDNKTPVRFEILRFSAGEEFVKLQGPVKSVTWIYEGDHELMQLALIFDVISRQDDPQKVDLYLPYIPHGRQDRATTKDQPYSLRVFIQHLSLIISGRVHRVYTVDPHSQVSLDLFRHMGLDFEVTPQHAFAPLVNEFSGEAYDFVVAPDKGAAQKTLEWSKALNVPMFLCDKVRDPSSGWITGYSVPNVDLKGKKVLIPDDVIDGGKTFEVLAQSLQEKGCNHIDLFVTHGIFSKGMGPLIVYNHIYTTNTLPYPQNFKNVGCNKLTVFDFKAINASNKQ
jgi:ribose-phosphate pyrophosphokinase